MTCYVPQNQPLYQALLEKAASYPPEKPYQAKAYTDAAHQISLMKVPVSTDGKIYTGSLPSSIPTLGSVYLFCRDTISRLYSTPNTHIDTSQNIRRSSRNIDKPSINYTYKTYSDDDDSDHDSDDSEYCTTSNKPITEDEAIEKAIHNNCQTNGYVFSPNYIREFNDWYSSKEAQEKLLHLARLNGYTFTKLQSVKCWLNWGSITFKILRKNKRLLTTLKQYCNKRNIIHNNHVTTRFLAWYLDNFDNSNSTMIYSTSNTYHHDRLIPSNIPNLYLLPNSIIIKNWFSTLQLSIV
jgi:hypothetical protein